MKNQRAGWNLKSVTPFVTAQQEFDPTQRAHYALEEFKDYLRDSGLTEEDFRGKNILELGPGENLGVALLFLNAGAHSVTCVDRFSSLHSSEKQLATYAALEKKIGLPLLGRFVEEDSQGVHFSPQIRYLKNVAGEHLGDHVSPSSIDIVISRAVLEHVYDVATVLNSMDATLKPGGTMIHEIDFRDHGMFSSYGLHPLTFMTFRGMLWKRMSDQNGSPNRKLLGYFRSHLERLGYTGTYQQILTVGGPLDRAPAPLPATDDDIHETARTLVRQIRPALASPFRELSDLELSISGIFLTVRKPGNV
jgi:SAM-dependent methyltransferase